MTTPTTTKIPAGMLRVTSLVAAIKEYAEDQEWCGDAEAHTEAELGLTFKPYFAQCCPACDREMADTGGVRERFVLADGNPEFIERAKVAKSIRKLVDDEALSRSHAVALGRAILGDEAPVKERRWRVSFIVTSTEESDLDQWDAGYALKEESDAVSQVEITELV